METNTKTSSYTYKDEEIFFDFKTNLSAIEKIEFVNTVTELIVGDNYNSIIKDLIFDFEIVDIFSNIDLSKIKNSPDVICKIEEFLNETSVAQIIKTNINDGLIDEFYKATNDNITYRTGFYKNPIDESLSSLLSAIENKISKIDADSVMKIIKKLDAFSNNLTTEKIIDAYSKSELFKKHFKNEKSKLKNKKSINR